MKTQSIQFFSELEPVRRRLDQWRRTRRHKREPIPEALWTAMGRLAGCHGVSRSARALGVGYYDLKRRALTRASKPQAASDPCPFVEVPAPVAAPPTPWVIELVEPSGARMVMRLPGASGADAAALVQAFRRAQP